MTRVPIRPTMENLRSIGAEPLTQWLIAAATRRATLTYGEARERLERQEGFSRIFSVTMGQAADETMHRLLAELPSVPPLNVLLVNRADGMPGVGAGPFLADYLKDDRLRRPDVRKRDPGLWRQAIERAASDVYAYQGWGDLYQRVYHRDCPSPHDADPKWASSGSEKDGLQLGRIGEGPNHKALRLWVRDNPAEIRPRLKGVRSETEVDLLSGDRVDVVYYAKPDTVAIEVKSRDSNEQDLLRGVYQCVKYRAVLRAMDPREHPPVSALLVTEVELPKELKELARRLQVKHFIAPMERPA